MEWISVKDRLPSDCVDVYIWDGEDVDTDFYSGNWRIYRTCTSGNEQCIEAQFVQTLEDHLFLVHGNPDGPIPEKELDSVIPIESTRGN